MGVVRYAYLGLVETTSFLVSAFSIVCMCFIFKKAGEEWWKAIIPVYNIYVFFRISSFTLGFWLSIIAGVAVVALSVAAALAGDSAVILFLIAVLVLLGIVAINVIQLVRLSDNFGKSRGFAAGLVLLPLIFDAILAFDKNSTYCDFRNSAGYTRKKKGKTKTATETIDSEDAW